MQISLKLRPKVKFRMLNTKMTFILIFKVIVKVKFKVKGRDTEYRPEITPARVPKWSQTIDSLPEQLTRPWPLNWNLTFEVTLPAICRLRSSIPVATRSWEPPHHWVFGKCCLKWAAVIVYKTMCKKPFDMGGKWFDNRPALKIPITNSRSNDGVPDIVPKLRRHVCQNRLKR